MFDILERDVPGDLVANIVYYCLIAVVLASVLGAVLATVRSLSLRDHVEFVVGEYAVLTVFTVEYLLRLWVAPEHPLRRRMPSWKARLRYLVSVPALIDLIAILPAAIAQFSDFGLQTVLVLRLLRFLKLTRYSSGFNALFLAVRRERYALLACLVILGAGVLMAATASYLAERVAQPDKFGSIPEAMWWAITTLTTVGYGDVVPVTPLGRLIGAMTMVAGLVMLALPIAIISSSFSEVISKHNFVVTFSMISRLPPFSDFDAPVLGDLMGVLHSRSYDRGALVVRRGEGGGRLFVVLEGQLELDNADGVLRLGPGDLFEVNRGDGHEKPATVRAMSRCKVLTIEDDALHALMLRHPDVMQRLAEMAARKAPDSAPAKPAGGDAEAQMKTAPA